MKNDFFIENVRLIVRDLMRVTGWKENFLLARLVTSQIYGSLKILESKLTQPEKECLINMFCGQYNISNTTTVRPHSEESKAFAIKILCFEEYCAVKNKPPVEVAELFVLHSIGTYLETCYEVIKSSDIQNIIIDLDIYISAREIAHQSEL